MRWPTSCISAALVSACAVAPPVPPQEASASRATALAADYCARAQVRPAAVYRLDPAQSSVRIYAFRAGAAAAVGHDHVLSVPQFVGYAELPAAGFSGARFDLEFALADLAVDAPALRAATGGTFAEALTQEDAQGTRRHLLGEKSLQAERFPYVEIHSLAVAGDPPLAAARLALTLHGVRREQDVALRVTLTDARLTARGAWMIRQSDFAITPYAVFGGLLAVADPVVIEFEIVGVPLRACQP
jgi:hypothetical protein